METRLAGSDRSLARTNSLFAVVRESKAELGSAFRSADFQSASRVRMLYKADLTDVTSHSEGGAAAQVNSLFRTSSHIQSRAGLGATQRLWPLFCASQSAFFKARFGKSTNQTAGWLSTFFSSTAGPWPLNFRVVRVFGGYCFRGAGTCGLNSSANCCAWAICSGVIWVCALVRFTLISGASGPPCAAPRLNHL